MRVPGSLAGLALALLACGPAIEPPPAPEAGPAEGGIALRDVTAASGLAFRHRNGASARRYLPETMGSGVAFADLDGDELPDLFFVDGLGVDELGAAPAGSAGRLYRNRGDGRFEDVTADGGFGSPFLAMGVAIGDVDADGRLDLFVSGVGEQRLYRNLGSFRFEDVTAAAGLSLSSQGGDLGFGSSAAFFDADRDGRLDLLVGRYVPWTPATDVRCSPDGQHPTYCTPESYPSAENVFYRGLGGGRFEERTREAGLDRPAGKTLGLAALDFDGDGWLDVAVANDTDRNHLFRNRGDGSFEEVGAEAGIALGSSGAPRGAMGIDAGDVDGDGRLDLAIGNFAQELSALYVAREGGVYRDEAARFGVGIPSLMQVAFGTLLVDLDQDGALDLVFANGHIEPEIAAYQSVQSYRQPLGIYLNRLASAGEFEPAPAEGALAEDWVGRGLAAADYDGDGDPDLVLTQNGDRAVLLRNEGGPREGAWLRVRARGRRSGDPPYGARLVATTSERRLERVLISGRSYLSASEPVLTFGLRAEEAMVRLEIEWPAGSVQVVESPTLSRLLVVEEEASAESP